MILPKLRNNQAMNDESKALLVQIGKAQIDGMFARQQEGPAIDDADFLPLVAIVLSAFERNKSDKMLADELWDYAFAVYDRMCQENDPRSTTAKNEQLMLSYLVEKRRAKRRKRSSSLPRS
jgi:hypothetical protein